MSYYRRLTQKEMLERGMKLNRMATGVENRNLTEDEWKALNLDKTPAASLWERTNGEMTDGEETDNEQQQQVSE